MIANNDALRPNNYPKSLDEFPKTKAQFEKFIYVDCCIVAPLRPIIIAEEDMGEDYDPWTVLPKVTFFYHNTEKQVWGYTEFGRDNFKYPRAAHLAKEGEMLVIGERGEVRYHGLGDNKQFEKPIPTSLLNGVYSIKNIYGTVYVVGTHRGVLRRDGVNQWTHMSEVIHQESKRLYDLAKKKGGDFDPGFSHIDGFAADKDLYAGGGLGDIWHYDGADWLPVDTPLPKMQISGICCATDGYVYIAGRYGALLRGREDEWRVIDHKQTRSDFRDIVEYDGVIYLCTEGALYTLQDDTLVPVDFGEMGTPYSFSALYANHGLLMVTGSFNACLFDGNEWKVIYGSTKIDELLEFNLLKQVATQLEDTVDQLREVITDKNQQSGTKD